MSHKVSSLLLVLLALAITAGNAQTKPLTNNDIVQMTKASFDEQTIVKAIQAHETAFDTSVDAMVSLKDAGVTKTVIEAMLDAQAKNRSGSQPAPSKQEEPVKPTTAGGPAREQAATSEEWPAELAGMYREVGIYYKQDGKFVQLYGRPVVASQTGGFLKSSLTMGMSKIRSKGQVPGKHAQLEVPTRQPNFYFYMAEGRIPDDFVVVRMQEKGDRREYQVGSFGGAAGGMSTGLELHKVSQLIIERVASHVYRVRPDGELQDGEYGFLGSSGGGEKVYDFGVHMKRK